MLTVLKGASIIDLVILVIDVTKGIQTQTAEGIIIAEIATPTLFILLNKIDLVPEAERESRITLMKTRISKALSSSHFRKIVFVPFSAKPQSMPGGGLLDDKSESTAEQSPSAETGQPGQDSGVPRGGSLGMAELLDKLSELDEPKRVGTAEPLLMAVDHCFSIKGQGSVATGTLLRGTLQLNQLVELVGHHSTHKVKSMEVFKKRVKSVSQGERVGVLLPSLDASLVERGLLAQPNSVPFASSIIVSLQKIRYYKREVETGSKIHISIGHFTSLAKITLFEAPSFHSTSQLASSSSLQQEKSEAPREGTESTSESTKNSALPPFVITQDYPLLKVIAADKSTSCYALLQLEKGLPVPSGSLYMASRLDADVNTPSCRLAFYGHVLAFVQSDASPSASSTSATTSSSTPQASTAKPAAQTSRAASQSASAKKQNATASSVASSSQSAASSSPVSSEPSSSQQATSPTTPTVALQQLRIYTTKAKTGSIDRVVDDYILIGRNLFKKETQMSLFQGLIVQVGEHRGVIESAFGSSGKFKVRFENPVAKSIPPTSEIVLTLKKYIFDVHKTFRQ